MQSDCTVIYDFAQVNFSKKIHEKCIVHIHTSRRISKAQPINVDQVRKRLDVGQFDVMSVLLIFLISICAALLQYSFE